MRLKAIFIDFYGTLVHEDDEVIRLICERIKANSVQDCHVGDIGTYWWKVFSRMCQASFGETFKSQQEIGIASLAETIRHFCSDCVADEIIEPQFAYWMKPEIYPDTFPFIRAFESVPVYILSNIDTAHIVSAIGYHRIPVTGVITSEDVRAYKPRPELFAEALNRYRLKPDEVIHIGDSITSDVKGAGHLGIKTVWLNRLGKRKTEGIGPDYVCRDLTEVRQMLMREFEWN
jgi:2-haloacid dehalogenase/putative hydrolase of the HAD superfamily